jgi:hypothetical protein
LEYLCVFWLTETPPYPLLLFVSLQKRETADLLTEQVLLNSSSHLEKSSLRRLYSQIFFKEIIKIENYFAEIYSPKRQLERATSISGETQTSMLYSYVLMVFGTLFLISTTR